MICLKLFAILTVVTLAHRDVVEAKKFDDLPEDEKTDVLDLLNHGMEETKLSPFRIIQAGLEKIYHDSLDQTEEETQSAIQEEHQQQSKSDLDSYVNHEPIVGVPDLQSAPDIAPQPIHGGATIRSTSTEAVTQAQVSEQPKEEFEEHTYIDDSDPNNPEVVNAKKRKSIEVSPNGRSEVHEVSQTSQTINPNSSYKHQSSSSSSSSMAYSSSTSSSYKPIRAATFVNQPVQPAMSWPKFTQMSSVPPFTGMPAMPPMPPMTMMPYGIPLASQDPWRGFYPMGGFPIANIPGASSLSGTVPMSKRQAKKLARRQMWEAKKKQAAIKKQQAEA